MCATAEPQCSQPRNTAIKSLRSRLFVGCGLALQGWLLQVQSIETSCTLPGESRPPHSLADGLALACLGKALTTCFKRGQALFVTT